MRDPTGLPDFSDWGFSRCHHFLYRQPDSKDVSIHTNDRASGAPSVLVKDVAHATTHHHHGRLFHVRPKVGLITQIAKQGSGRR